MSDTKLVSDSRSGSGIAIKDILIALPLLGTALAVTYDVGYFWGLDINFFSTFSLAEHLTFTLEIIPFALALSTIAIIAPFAIQFGVKAGKKSATYEATTGKRMPFYKEPPNWILFGCCAWNIWWAYHSGSMTSVVALIFLVSTTVIVSSHVTLAHIFALLFSAAIFAFAIAFSFGVDVAKDFRRSTSYHYTITPLQGAAIAAKIARSGDKGLLFMDKNTNALVLLPWNQIRDVSSTP